MMKLIESLRHWGSKEFSSALKMELIRLGTDNLPLQEAATPGTFVMLV